MFEFVSLLLAAVMLMAIAFPQRFMPVLEARKRKVGSSYWGVYEGSGGDELADEKYIDVPKPARKWHAIAGSSQYASGKGTSMRR